MSAPKEIRDFLLCIFLYKLDDLKALVEKYGAETVISCGTLCRVAGRNLEMVEYLLSLGADPNQMIAYERYGFPTFPLYEATRSGKVDIIQALYNYGANINQEFTDDSNRRALSAVVGYNLNDNHLNALKKLLELGADVNYHYYPFGKEGFCCSPLGETIDAREYAKKRDATPKLKNSTRSSRY